MERRHHEPGRRPRQRCEIAAGALSWVPAARRSQRMKAMPTGGQDCSLSAGETSRRLPWDRGVARRRRWPRAHRAVFAAMNCSWSWRTRRPVCPASRAVGRARYGRGRAERSAEGPAPPGGRPGRPAAGPPLLQAVVPDALRSKSPAGGSRSYPRTSGPWARAVHESIARIGALLPAGHRQAVIELTEHALGRVQKAMSTLDDSSGWLTPDRHRPGASPPRRLPCGTAGPCRARPPAVRLRG
jgi:hypothetical protein